MPLRAQVDGQEVISSFLSENEWIELKQKIRDKSFDVIICQTNKKGYLRTSKLGLQHFVHKKGEKPDDWKPESPQHLLAKNEILLGCKDAGWNAKSEYIENDWIADVLAQKGNARVAFEVQWSRQTLERTRERQENYKNSNVRGCWFFKTPPKEILGLQDEVIADKAIPAFRIMESEDKTIKVRLNDKAYTLRNFTRKLLCGEVKFRNKLSVEKQRIKISFWKTSCWKCGTEQYVYFVEDIFSSECNHSIRINSSFGSGKNLEFYPQVLQAIKEIKQTSEGGHIHIGPIKKRYSRTAKRSYLSFGCLKCDSIFGEFPLMEERLEIACGDGNPFETFEKDIMLKEPIVCYVKPHWFVTETDRFYE